MHPKRILIVGNYGAGNLGDDAIFAGIVEELRSLGYKGQIELTHGSYPSSNEIYDGFKKNAFAPSGILSSIKKSRNEAKKAIKRSDLVILGGGGLFIDSESKRAPYIWGRQAILCKKMQKPYFCYGQSIGPITDPNNKSITKEVFDSSGGVHVRDMNSVNFLRSINFDKDITVGTDPALTWLQKQDIHVKKEKIIAISIREWPGVVWDEILEAILHYSAQKGLRPVFVQMDTRNHKENSLIAKTGRNLFHPKSSLEALTFFKKAEIAITMRLHASIFAMVAGTPFVALSYSDKVKGLMDQMQISKGAIVLQPKDWNSSKIQEALNKIRNEKPAYNSMNLQKKNLDFLARHVLCQK